MSITIFRKIKKTDVIIPSAVIKILSFGEKPQKNPEKAKKLVDFVGWLLK